MTAYMFSLSRLSGPFLPQNRDLLREKTVLFPPEGLCHGVSEPAPLSWVEPLGKHLRATVTLKDWKRQRIFTLKNTSRRRRQLQIETQVSDRRTEKHTAHWTAFLCSKTPERDNMPTLVQASAQTSGSSCRPSSGLKGSLLALGEGRGARGGWLSEPPRPRPPRGNSWKRTWGGRPGIGWESGRAGWGRADEAFTCPGKSERGQKKKTVGDRARCLSVSALCNTRAFSSFPLFSHLPIEGELITNQLLLTLQQESGSSWKPELQSWALYNATGGLSSLFLDSLSP